MGFFKGLSSAIPLLGRSSSAAGPQMGNPAAAGMEYLKQIPSAVGEYYKPFISSGREAEGITNPIYGQMSQNPQEFLDAIMRGYNPSEGYRFKERELGQAARNDAAMGGFLGTPTSQMQQADLIRGLLGEDMQQFLSNVLGIQSGGLSGQEGRIDRGYKAGLGYGDILGSNLAQQAGMAYQGAQHYNQDRANRAGAQNAFRGARSNMFGNILGTGAKLFGGGF